MLYFIENLVKTREQGEGYTLLIRRFCVARGDKLAITGPSGCGKSTTLDILGLALRPDGADQFVFSPRGGAPVDMLAEWRDDRQDAMAGWRLKHMGYVLQTGGLLPFVNVAENMALPARMRGIDAAAIEEAIRTLSERLNMAHLLHAMPGTLSVGERQRTAIVRALASQPELILADEPTAALDPIHAERVMEEFVRAVEDRGCALALVTHDAGLAQRSGLREVRMVVERVEDGVRAVLHDTVHNEAAQGGTPCAN